MGSNWKLVAFPLILPWRKEFWTLPLYFVDLQVGVIPGWPEVVPYRGRPLPPEAVASGNELRHYHPGELRQRQAFKNFLETREEVDDIVRELKGLPREALEEGLPSAEAWSLVWQMEKMQADEEARMIHVDQGETWLAEILSPEPWDNQKSFGATGSRNGGPGTGPAALSLVATGDGNALEEQLGALSIRSHSQSDIRIAERLAGVELHQAGEGAAAGGPQ